MIGIGFDLSRYTLLHSEPPLDDSFTKKKSVLWTFIYSFVISFKALLKFILPKCKIFDPFTVDLLYFVF